MYSHAALARGPARELPAQRKRLVDDQCRMVLSSAIRLLAGVDLRPLKDQSISLFRLFRRCFCRLEASGPCTRVSASLSLENLGGAPSRRVFH